MLTVCIPIPAQLHAALYARFKEETGDEINNCLSQLLLENKNSSSRESGTSHFMRPGKGTITGRVWEIADDLYAKTGQLDREDVVAACMEEGIKMNTASTQFSHWKKAMTESEGHRHD